MLVCSSSPSYSVHIIYTAFQDYCLDHCECAAQPSEGEPKPKQVSSMPSKGMQYNENSDPNQPIPAHTCSGTCTEVARSCSWAYTGECMCTADPVPDPWGLFASHGCVAVMASSHLGGRDLVSNHSNGDAPVNSTPVAAPEKTNSIVKGSNGYYNASTGIQVACPCNSTCVSYGCCGSNGLTWAPADKCLGELDMSMGDGGP